MKSFKSTMPRCIGKQTLAALTLVAAAGSMASADAATAASSCTVFAPDQIIPGQNFDLRVSRVPGYPGGWFSPTFSINMTYPTQPGWEYSQSEDRTIPRMDVIRADFTLRAPNSLFPDPNGGFVTGGTVNIVVVVTEASSRGKQSRILCTATTAMGM